MAKFYVWDPDNSERDEAKSYDEYHAEGAAQAHAERLFHEEPFEAITLHVEDSDKGVTKVEIIVNYDPVFSVTETVVL